MPHTIDVEALELPVPGPPRDLEPADPRGKWPRMLNLDRETDQRLKDWLDHEIELARLEKQDIIADWEKWQRQYWAKPSSEIKNFPFRRAANVVVPLTAIAVEAVVARLMGTLFAVEPFWSVRPRAKSWIEAAPKYERFLQTEAENPNALNAYNFSQDTLTELVKLGTCCGKSGYEKQIRKSIRAREDGEDEVFYAVNRDSATLEYVPIANLLVRAHDTDPQEAAWVGEEHSFTWGQLKRMAQAGRMRPEAVEAIKDWVNISRVDSTGDAQEYQAKLDELQRHEPIWHDKFNVQEVWASFDVDLDGEDEEVVVDFHRTSKTILSIRYNWYADLHRPYRITQYIRVEGRIWGIGVGKQNEQFQEIITTVIRQRLDNATLANMRTLAVKKGSGITPDEPIFPGKMWFVDDPTRDIQPIQLSEIYQSSLFNEQSILNYSERRTGANEVVLGMPQQGTPGTATGDLARLAEGNKKFDLVLRNVRFWLGLLGMDVTANYQQFGTQQRHWLSMEEDGQWVEQILRMPGESVRNGAIIEITATSSITNKSVEQQQWLGLFQVLTQYFEKIIQLADLMQNQELLVEAALRAVSASDEAMKRLLRTFDVVDAESLLLLKEEDRARIRREGPGGLIGGNGGGQQGLLPNAGLEGMEPLLEALASAGGLGGGRGAGR